MHTAESPLSPLDLDCLRALEAHSVRYLLIGGHAVRAYGSSRNTKDLDVLIDNTSDNAERFVTAMTSLGINHSNLTAANIIGQKRQINFTSWGYNLEVLTAANGIPFEEAYSRRILLSYGGVTIPVLAKVDLIAMKESAGRPKDLEDVGYLREVV